MDKIRQLIRHLELEPHPEGGYFRETYRSEGQIDKACLDPAYSNARNYSTAIYFLLTSDQFSAFHRIHQDEIWHFYEGSPIELHMISENGSHNKVIIGSDILHGEVPQFIVPGGNWFASRVSRPDHYSLAGCTVSPGFDFDDFELASREKLVSKFPTHKEIISRFTRV